MNGTIAFWYMIAGIITFINVTCTLINIDRKIRQPKHTAFTTPIDFNPVSSYSGGGSGGSSNTHIGVGGGGGLSDLDWHEITEKEASELMPGMKCVGGGGNGIGPNGGYSQSGTLYATADYSRQLKKTVCCYITPAPPPHPAGFFLQVGPGSVKWYVADRRGEGERR